MGFAWVLNVVSMLTESLMVLQSVSHRSESPGDRWKVLSGDCECGFDTLATENGNSGSASALRGKQS